jgi:hypothetical protein
VNDNDSIIIIIIIIIIYLFQYEVCMGGREVNTDFGMET